jgi:hypothetical protein
MTDLFTPPSKPAAEVAGQLLQMIAADPKLQEESRL